MQFQDTVWRGAERKPEDPELLKMIIKLQSVSDGRTCLWPSSNVLKERET